MHVHILGICGTFMGGIAVLARSLGYRVTGQDAHVYPPMSTQLEELGIGLTEGYDPADIPREADIVVIGNALSRGNPCVEFVLDRNMRYTSGPQWLAEHVLSDRWVIAVAGTHGKTTTSSMVAQILEYAGLSPGFLIGGVPLDFGRSARLGEAPFFVVEADEYDTAFFDKRSKFVHYRPRTALLNNLEYDHADIFPDLQSIQRQFHHFVRTVPGQGLIITANDDEDLDQVLAMGCWTPIERFSLNGRAGWSAREMAPNGGAFDVCWEGNTLGRVEWKLVGEHNVKNALAAIAAARHAGVPAEEAIAALAAFGGVKRRMEVVGTVGGVTVYDDFAHHPTAIALTLGGLRQTVGTGRILAILEPRSNTMRMGTHREALAPALIQADRIMLYSPADLGWDLRQVARSLGERAAVFDTVDSIVRAVGEVARPGDHVLIMSNGGFGGIHERLLEVLEGSAHG